MSDSDKLGIKSKLKQMISNLLMDLFSEQKFLILNLCTFFGTPVDEFHTYSEMMYQPKSVDKMTNFETLTI